MSRILPQPLRDKYPTLVARNEPHSGYWLWFHIDQDPNWFQYRTILSCYINYIGSLDEKWLNLALEEYGRIPTTFDLNRNRMRQEGIYWCVCYELLKPHLTVEVDEIWVQRLYNMGQEMLNSCRIGDLDECLSYFLTWMKLDNMNLVTELHPEGSKFLLANGSTPGQLYYVGEDAPEEIGFYIQDVMKDANIIQGGFYDASTSYFLNTSNIICFAAAALGIENMPAWFHTWAVEAVYYLIHAPSYDIQIAEQHGDTEGYSEAYGKWYHYRAPLMWSLIGLGYGDDAGELVEMAYKLKPATKPSELYNMHSSWYLLFTDPELLEPSGTPRPTNTPINISSSGTVMYNGNESSFYAQLLNPKWDDHGYMGSWIDIVWRHKGENILYRPGGYSIGNNEWHNHNGMAMKNNGWFAKREFLGVITTPEGFIAKSRMFGPVTNRYYHDVERWGADTDFEGCEILAEIEYNDVEKWCEIRHTWVSPGGTFPWWTTDLPVTRQNIHAEQEPIAINQNGFRYTTPLGQTIQVTSTGTPTLTTKNLRVPWWVMQFASYENSGTMSVRVQTTWSDIVVPPPPPPPPPPPDPIPTGSRNLWAALLGASIHSHPDKITIELPLK